MDHLPLPSRNPRSQVFSTFRLASLAPTGTRRRECDEADEDSRVTFRVSRPLGVPVIMQRFSYKEGLGVRGNERNWSLAEPKEGGDALRRPLGPQRDRLSPPGSLVKVYTSRPAEPTRSEGDRFTFCTFFVATRPPFLCFGLFSFTKVPLKDGVQLSFRLKLSCGHFLFQVRLKLLEVPVIEEDFRGSVTLRQQGFSFGSIVDTRRRWFRYYCFQSPTSQKHGLVFSLVSPYSVPRPSTGVVVRRDKT